MTPIVSGEFVFENEKINFSSMVEKGELRTYIIYKDKLFDMNYFFKNFFFISRVYAFEQYYKNKFKEHLSKIIDGPELEYVFMYFGAIIHMKIEKDSVQDGMMITKVSELFLYFDEEEKIYTIEAFAGNKIYQKFAGKISVFYERLQITLGYYENSEDLKNMTSLVGKYIDLSKGYQINKVKQSNFTCMQPQTQRTLQNLMNTGLVKITNQGLIDVETKDKLLETLRKKLSGVIRDELIVELAEY